MEAVVEGTTLNEKYISQGVFHKIPRGESKQIFKLLRPIDGIVYGNLVQFNPYLAYRSLDYDPHENILKEIKTLRLWKKYGINTPEIINWDNKTLELKHISNSENYKTLFKRNLGNVGDLLDLYQQIRDLALSKEDKDLFHSDPHLANFISDVKKTYAIDPGIVIRPDFDLQETDKHLNLFFLHDFFSNQIDPDVTNQAIKSFSPKERREIKELNKRFMQKSFGNLMWVVRSEIVRALKGEERKANFIDNSRTLDSML